MTSKNSSSQQECHNNRVDKNTKLPQAIDKKNNKAVKLIPMMALLFSMIAIGAAGFSIYRLHNFVSTLPESENYVNNHAEVDDLQQHIAQLEASVEKQSVQLNQYIKQLENLSTQEKSLKHYIDQQISGVNANQAEIRQRMVQFSQSYLEPSTILAQQIQLMVKHVVINNLQFAKNAWEILGNRSYALFFLNQANAALLKLDHSGPWLDKIYAIKIAIEHGQSLLDSLHQIAELSSKLNQLELLPPLSTSKPQRAVKHEPHNNWQIALYESWEYIQSLISVHKISDVDRVLIDAHRRADVRAVVFLELSELRLSLINQLPENFERTQSNIELLIKNYFINDQAYQTWVDLLHKITLPQTTDIEDLINQIIHNIDQIKTSDQMQAQIAK